MSKCINILEIIKKQRGMIMCFSALLVVFFHEWICIFDKVPVISDIEDYIKGIGYLAVDIFFFLSGIGLTYSVNKSTLLEYYYKRMKRLILPFVIVGVFRMITEPWDFITFLKCISGFRYLRSSIYCHLWFVPSIAIVYIVFPFYNRILKRIDKPILVTGITLMVWLVFSILFRNTERFDVYLFTNRIPIILIGIMYGYLSQHPKDYSKKLFEYTTVHWILCVLSILAGGYLCYRYLNYGFEFLFPKADCCIPTFLLTVGLVPVLAVVFSLIKSGSVRKCFEYIGQMTLEMYCIHEWLGLQLVPFLKNHMSDLWVNIVLFICILIATWLLYIFVKFVWKGVELLMGYKK